MELWAITRSAAVNVPEYVTLGVHVCWVYAWGEIAGLWDFLVFSSGRYCLTVFQNIYTSLHSHQAWMRFPFVSLMWSVLFILAVPMSVICISLMAHEVELFLYFLALLFFLVKGSWRTQNSRETFEDQMLPWKFICKSWALSEEQALSSIFASFSGFTESFLCRTQQGRL